MSVESGWSLEAPPYRVPEPGDPAVVGPYRIEGVLGEGSLGRVHLGRTPAGAAVAVKVLHREFAADNGFRTRLAQELAIIRQVQGLYTVPVVAADPWAERPWLASAYVAGPSLRYAVTENGPGAQDTVLRLVAGTAEALQSLHAAGVVHRDLTPANILLTTDGPRLTDFGVSRAADGTAVTRTGSPAYLAPEYIRGEEVTGAADVFTLGLSAYFAATGRLAFGGGQTHAVAYRILEQEPDLAGCPEPLRDIVVACLRKDPRQRPTPAEIIERCQAPGQPAPPAAQPPAPPPPPLSPAAPPFTQPTQPVAAVPAPPPQPRLARRTLLLGGTGLAVAAGLGVTIPLLWPDDDEVGEDSQDSKPRSTGAFRLVATLSGHTASINSVAFSPDGRQLATMSGEDVRLWDVATHKQRAVLTGDAIHAFGLAFSPDGRLLATADDQTVSLWDVADREPVATLTGHTGGITDVAFSPDGQLLATASEDETARLWDVRSGRQTAVLDGHNASVGGVDFHPGGRLLASCASWAALLWDIPSGTQQHVLDGHDNLLNVAFSPDGAVLAAADAGTSVILWDTAVIGQQKAVLGDRESPISDLAFSQDGRLLATAGRETVTVWDVAGGSQRAAIDTGDDPFTEVAFSSTGMLATSSDAEVSLWEMT